MTTAPFNQSAFPIPFDDRPGSYQAEAGMTLRDYFAAKAIHAALTGAKLPGLIERDPETMEALDKLSAAMYAVADSMLLARVAR